MQNKRIFCGGTFCFDYREDGYEDMATDQQFCESISMLQC